MNVQNGMVRVADGVLVPHSPEYLSVVQLPVKHVRRRGETFTRFVCGLAAVLRETTAPRSDGEAWHDGDG